MKEPIQGSRGGMANMMKEGLRRVLKGPISGFGMIGGERKGRGGGRGERVGKGTGMQRGGPWVC